MKVDNKQLSLSTLVPAGASVFAVTGLLAYRWWQNRNTPPQFRMGLPVLGPIIQFLKDPLELMHRGHKAVGGCFQVNFLAQDMVFLVGREGQEFFFTMDKYLDQAKMYAFTIPIFGKKVLYDTDYSTRMCQLRFIKERLTEESMASYCQTLEHEVVQYFGDCWRGGSGTVDIRHNLVECLTRTSIRCLMGHELRAIMHNVVREHTICELLNIMEQGLLPLSVFMPNLPIARHRARDAARKEMSELLTPIIQKRRRMLETKEEIKADDLLWKLMTGTYPDGRRPDDEEVVGFLVAAFFGGMHNSSITTSWSTLEIVTRPELVRELIEEQMVALGGLDKPFTYEGYTKMKKLRSTVMEVLRLHPPLMLLMRTVEQDVPFKDYTIRKGSVVAVSPNVAGMLEEDYPSPADFKPFRFVDTPPDEFTYIPFGGGRRLCKGQEFGFLQVMCVLSHMLRHFDLEAPDGVTKPTIGEGMVIAPSQPCRVNFKRKVVK